MSEVEVKTPMTANPMLSSRGRHISRSLSSWFVTNQKDETWNKKRLNILHLGMLVLMAIAYACHIAGSPFLRFVEDQNILVPLYVIEGASLFVG